MKRRTFVKNLSASTGFLLLPDITAWTAKPMFFDISLAEWSLRVPLRKGAISNLDFPEVARKQYDIGAVEYVSGFFEDKEQNQTYLKQLRQRAEDQGVDNALIMIDLYQYKTASPDPKERAKAVEMHKPWIDAAHFLGCHAVRVNGNGYDEKDRQGAADALADTLHKLADYGKGSDINVLVENHGGFSSDGKWLAGVMQQVNREQVGTLPDFGNNRIKDEERYDRYLLVEELMPYAQGVSAKTYDFEPDGTQGRVDVMRLMKIVKYAGFEGYVGIEFGGKLEEIGPQDGVSKTKRLLEEIGKQLS